MDYGAAIEWVNSPLVAVFLLVFIIALFYHTQLGLQVVIEDYIDCKAIKITSLILLQLITLFAGLAAATAVLKIYLGS
jgi:succinate dehydrogenase / fumarate reductase membrane anchor subunit